MLRLIKGNRAWTYFAWWNIFLCVSKTKHFTSQDCQGFACDPKCLWFWREATINAKTHKPTRVRTHTHSEMVGWVAVVLLPVSTCGVHVRGQLLAALSGARESSLLSPFVRCAHHITQPGRHRSPPKEHCSTRHYSFSPLWLNFSCFVFDAGGSRVHGVLWLCNAQ